LAAVLALWLCLGFPAAVTAAGPPLTLGEAQLLALEHNPGLKATGMTVATAEADMAKARARFLPKVDVGETYNYSNNPTQVFMDKLNQRAFTQQDFQLSNLNYPRPYGNFRTGLTVSQPLFQGGQAYLGYKQAELGREMAAAMVLSARQQLLFQVIQAYYGVQLAQENLAVVKKSHRTAAEHVMIAESRYQSGAVVHADVLTGQVHLARIKQEELTAAGQVEIAKSALSTVIGQPEAGSRPLSPPPKEPPPLPKELANLQQVAQEKRPDLKRLALAARSAQEEVTKSRLNYLPRLRVAYQYDMDERHLFGHNGDSYTVMALMHFNLFNGLADLAKVRESQAKEAQARNLRQELQDRIRHQVTEAIVHLKTADERLRVAEASLGQARESLRLLRLRYETGIAILLELLNAEDALRSAELSRVEALFETHLAQAGLELALGTISGPAGERLGTGK
jgi:outer membrane protein